MKNIDLGKTGMKVSVIGLGTWAIGGGPAWGGDMDTQVCIDTICEAEKAGINLLDTAPGYNFGNSEIVVGKALKHKKREKIILTKLPMANSTSSDATSLGGGDFTGIFFGPL